MERIDLEAYLRDEVGKSFAKRLRKTGLIPAVVYKAGEETLNLKVRSRDLSKVLHTSAGENVIINLKVSADGGRPKSKTVIIKEIQYDPVRGDMLHVDFNQISLLEALKVKVPIVTKGEAIGVKRDGGILEQIIWELEVECLPTKIPEKIDIDISKFEIGISMFVKDLTVPEGVKVLTNSEQTVVTVSAPKVEVVEAKPEEEITEPEVIREKKPEAEEEAPEEIEEKKEKKEKKQKE